MRGMYIMAEETRLPVDIDAQPLVQAAAALQPELRSYREEIEREQRLPKALVEQLRAAGFYRMVIPRDLGGLEVDPLTYLRTVELLAEGAGLLTTSIAESRNRISIFTSGSDASAGSAEISEISTESPPPTVSPLRNTRPLTRTIPLASISRAARRDRAHPRRTR